MIIEEGDKVLVVHRRLYETDTPRFFVGIVDGYEAGIVKVTGYTFLREQFGGAFVRKVGARTKLLSLLSGALIVYRLSTDVELESIRIEADQAGGVILTDGQRLKMDLSEREAHRRSVRTDNRAPTS